VPGCSSGLVWTEIIATLRNRGSRAPIDLL
jgi:hypothetical protein